MVLTNGAAAADAEAAFVFRLRALAHYRACGRCTVSDHRHPTGEKRQLTRTGRGPHDGLQRNGRAPDAGRTRARPFFPGSLPPDTKCFQHPCLSNPRQMPLNRGFKGAVLKGTDLPVKQNRGEVQNVDYRGQSSFFRNSTVLFGGRKGGVHPDYYFLEPGHCAPPPRKPNLRPPLSSGIRLAPAALLPCVPRET
eukprot:gene8808-biopygen121